VVSPGVLVLRGPAPTNEIGAVAVPAARTGGRTLLWTSAAIAVVLFILRVSLAPALGAAVITLVALAWAWASLPFGGWAAAGPAIVAAAAGWIAALLSGVRQTRPASRARVAP
jgi:hypothetical protein